MTDRFVIKTIKIEDQFSKQKSQILGGFFASHSNLFHPFHHCLDGKAKSDECALHSAISSTLTHIMMRQLWSLGEL